jgi:predicted porin
LRGSEDLPGDLQAWYQIESRFDADTGGGLRGRNTAVGLKGIWGNLLFGFWDSPYKVAQVPFDPFGDVTIAGEENILGQASSTPAGDFHGRISNGIQYWTPQFGGLGMRFGYGANERRTRDLNPYLLAASLKYENGPFYAVAAAERHYDSGELGPRTSGGDDTGMEAGAGMKFGDTEVGLLFERLKYRTEAAGGSELRRDAWFVSAEHRIDQFILRGYYAVAGDQKGSNAQAGPATGAKAYSLGVAYDLSKRTQLYASYTRIDNERNAEYEFGSNADPVLEIKGRPGSVPSGVLVGMKHVF